MNITTVERTQDGELVTTSERIAAGTGAQHKNVLESITKYQADLEEFGGVAFETRPLDTAGGVQNRRVALLNEQQATLVLTWARNTEPVRAFKKELVKAFYEMANRDRDQATAFTIPQTLPEALRAYADAEEKRIVAEAEVAAARPAVAYVERYVADDDVLTVKAWAAQFEMTDPQARELLADRGILYRKRIGRRWSASRQQMVDVTEWRAYAGFIGLFDLRPQHNAPRHHNGQVKQTLYVRQARALDLAAALGMTHQVQSLDLTA